MSVLVSPIALSSKGLMELVCHAILDLSSSMESILDLYVAGGVSAICTAFRSCYERTSFKALSIICDIIYNCIISENSVENRR